jgi:hypothetical protein
MIFRFVMDCIETAMGSDGTAMYSIVQTHPAPIKLIETSLV